MNKNAEGDPREKSWAFFCNIPLRGQTDGPALLRKNKNWPVGQVCGTPTLSELSGQIDNFELSNMGTERNSLNQ